MVMFSELLQDQFLLSIIAELVGMKGTTIVEISKAVDVNLSCLREEDKRKQESLKFGNHDNAQHLSFIISGQE